MTGIVRPFAARVVRPEAAARNVAPMADALVAGSTAHRGSMHEVDAADYLRPTSGLYVYRLRHEEEEHVGVVADVSAHAFADGQVRGHEAVHPPRVESLVEHFTSVAVRSELVALLHDAGADVDRVVEETLAGAPLVDFTGPDGWQQTVWRVPDAAGPELADALGHSVHYVADGHHRVAASLALWEREGRPADAALLCVLYPLGGLRLRAFHRRVTGPVDPVQLRALLGKCCDVRELASGEVTATGISTYVDGCWLTAVPPGDRPLGVLGLDVTILERQVLAPLLGAAAAARTEIAPATSSFEELTGSCDQDGGALFVLAPPTLEQLMQVADLGQVMPPKTTYFDPKPYAGIIVR